MFHWETLFVVSAADAQDVSLPFVAQKFGRHLGAHALLVEDAQFVFIVDFEELLSSSSWIRNVQLRAKTRRAKIFLWLIFMGAWYFAAMKVTNFPRISKCTSIALDLNHSLQCIRINCSFSLMIFFCSCFPKMFHRTHKLSLQSIRAKHRLQAALGARKIANYFNHPRKYRRNSNGIWLHRTIAIEMHGNFSRFSAILAKIRWTK